MLESRAQLGKRHRAQSVPQVGLEREAAGASVAAGAKVAVEDEENSLSERPPRPPVPPLGRSFSAI